MILTFFSSGFRSSPNRIVRYESYKKFSSITSLANNSFHSFFLALTFNTCIFIFSFNFSSLLQGSAKVSWFSIKSVVSVYLLLQWSSACQQLVKRQILNSTHPSWLWNCVGLKGMYRSSVHVWQRPLTERKSGWELEEMAFSLHLTQVFPCSPP